MPGHCWTCQQRIWRGVIRPDTLEWVPLFPDPTSQYAILASAEGPAVGLGFCAEHAPLIGAAGPLQITSGGRPLGPTTVTALQAAPERYTHWYSDTFGHWLTAWLRELAVDFKTPESNFAPILAQWQHDREAVTVHG